MTEQIQIAAGLDLHKSFLIATILTLTGEKIVDRFNRTQSGLIALKNWVMAHNVQAVGCESTSDYWVQIYDLLIPICDVIVGNARDMKALSHKKTDKIDSEFIALITLKGMIHPSRIFPREHREFRSTIRLRHKLVQKRSSIKNEIHHILDSELFRLSSVLSDIFGKSGVLIMRGILNNEFEILKSVPGIGDIVAITLLAEIGDVRDFSTGDKLASWLGMVPRVYQSADKLRTGSITKRGSRVARWILVQAAHAAVKARDNDLKTFYSSKKDIIGAGKAIVSVARKMIIIIWHLLTNDEIYKDTQYQSMKQAKKVYVKIPKKTSIEEVLQLLRDAAVILKEPDPETG